MREKVNYDIKMNHIWLLMILKRIIHFHPDLFFFQHREIIRQKKEHCILYERLQTREDKWLLPHLFPQLFLLSCSSFVTIPVQSIYPTNKAHLVLPYHSHCCEREWATLKKRTSHHVDSIFIEGVPVCAFRVVHQNLWFEGPSNRALLKSLTWKT